MPLSQKDRQQLLGFLIFLAVVAVGGYWYMLWSPKKAEIAQLEAQIDSLHTQVDSAKRDLAEGTIESLRQRIEDFEASLQVMRQLVPTSNDIPDLLDGIASRASLRGVQIGEFNPQSQEPGGLFDIYRYRLTVFGHYDQVGEFLSDVASLPRIMVPYNVSIDQAAAVAQQAYGDTTGALLEVRFQLRTFVKSQTPGGTGEGS